MLINMKPTTFFVVINMRTSQGFECIGKFFVGDSEKAAIGIFRKLKGRGTVDERSPLQLDLMESRNGLPVNINMISCSLDELGENCRIITRELFRLINIEHTKT